MNQLNNVTDYAERIQEGGYGIMKQQTKANTESRISKKDYHQNHEHNAKKASMGPNTKQN